ncbi:MAG: hypothetical protein KKB59_18310, partial [Spirochaetes bacterium]|nr:hypothetical protein [Spirochaetota bacterium]
LPNLGENTFDNVLAAAMAAGATLKIDFTGEGKLCLTTKEKGSSQVLTVYERGIFNIDPASSRGTDECSSLEMSLDDVISELVFEPGTYTFVEVIAQIMGFFEDLEVETTPKNALKFTYTKNTEHPMKVSGGSALEALGLSTNMEASWAMVEQEDLAYVIADNGLEIIAEESVSIRFPSPAVTILEALESLGLEAEEYKGVAYNVVLGSQNATTFFPPIRNGDTLRVVLETEKDFVITDVESYKLDTPIDADCPPTGYVLSKGQKSYLSQKANIKAQYNAFMDLEDDVVSIKNATLKYIQGKGSSPNLSDVLQVLDNISALADNLQVNSIEVFDRFLKTLTSEKILLKMLMGIRIRELLGLDTEDTSNMAAAVKSTKSVLKLFTALEGADKLISEILARGSKTYG